MVCMMGSASSSTAGGSGEAAQGRGLLGIFVAERSCQRFPKNLSEAQRQSMLTGSCDLLTKALNTVLTRLHVHATCTSLTLGIHHSHAWMKHNDKAVLCQQPGFRTSRPLSLVAGGMPQ